MSESCGSEDGSDLDADESDFFPEEEVEAARACRTPSPNTCEMLERLAKEQEEAQAQLAEAEAAAQLAEAEAQRAAAAEAQRVANELLGQRKYNCFVGRVKTDLFQRFCRTHWHKELMPTPRLWTAVMGELGSCIRCNKSQFRSSANSRREEINRQAFINRRDLGVYRSIVQHNPDLLQMESITEYLRKELDETWVLSVHLPEVFVVQCCVAFVSLASRHSCTQVDHRIALLRTHDLCPHTDLQIRREARQLLLTLERLRRARDLPSEISRHILVQLLHVDPPTRLPPTHSDVLNANLASIQAAREAEDLRW